MGGKDGWQCETKREQLGAFLVTPAQKLLKVLVLILKLGGSRVYSTFVISKFWGLRFPLNSPSCWWPEGVIPGPGAEEHAPCWGL